MRSGLLADSLPGPTDPTLFTPTLCPGDNFPSTDVFARSSAFNVSQRLPSLPSADPAIPHTTPPAELSARVTPGPVESSADIALIPATQREPSIAPAPETYTKEEGRMSVDNVSEPEESASQHQIYLRQEQLIRLAGAVNLYANYRALRHPDTIPVLTSAEDVHFIIRSPWCENTGFGEESLDIQVNPTVQETPGAAVGNPLERSDEDVSQLLCGLLERGDRDLDYNSIAMAALQGGKVRENNGRGR